MQSKPKPFSKTGFLKSYLLPVLVTFLIPGFGLWFFDHVEADYDRQIRESLISQIQIDQRMTPEQRERATKFYESVPVSRILASNKPEAKHIHHQQFVNAGVLPNTF